MLHNKSKKIIILLLLVIAGVGTSYGQKKYTISGIVKDSSNGETLTNATVVAEEIANANVLSNNYGFYSLSLAEGTYSITCRYTGFTPQTKVIKVTQNEKINFTLKSKSSAIKEIVVKGAKKINKVETTTMGIERLDLKETGKLPVLFGEKDILKTIQLLPGVKSAGEGNSGFSVRGGSTDQNLILLDEAPVYNSSHLLGFFSTFNSDALKDATIIKGNSPANYGGRLSSVLDVKMKDGNNKDYNVAGGIGLISSRLSVEGPIQKDKSSFIVSGRRTYADAFLQATDEFKNNTLYFYDFNAKANYKINEKNRIYASGYFGRDVLGFGESFGIDWGNTTGTLRWNSILSNKLFSNTSLIYSKYNYDVKIGANGNNFNINSSIKDWNIKQDFDLFATNKSKWKFGFQSIYHDIKPSRFQSEGDRDSTFNEIPQDSRYSLENAVYANNVYKINNKLSVDYGVRGSFFTLLGGGKYNTYESGKLADSTYLAKGEFGKTYVIAEPRVSFNYLINSDNSVKLGYARNAQNLHLLSNSTASSPTDQWIGTSYSTKPEIADQIAGGYFKNFKNNTYELSVETYYKSMQNQVDYKDGADINQSPDVESELLYGDGRAYGLEIGLKKKTGKFTGWLSYTLSRTERKIDGINDGAWYLARQDRLHDLTLVGTYQLNTKWSFSSNFVFYTGNAVTFPSGKYEVNGTTTYYYTSRNGYRMPNYHRWDLSATYEGKKHKRYQANWNFGLYNVYGRENAWTINFEDDPNIPNQTRAVQTALFKYVPSVTYNFKF